MAGFVLLLIKCFLLAYYLQFSPSYARRFGAPLSNVLRVHSLVDENDKFEVSIENLHKLPFSASQRVARDESAKFTTSDVAKQPLLSPNASKVHHLNDSNMGLIVQWAGNGSGVIVVFSRNLAQGNTSTTSLYVSYDDGNTFEKRVLKVDDTRVAIISAFGISQTNHSRFIFTDLIHNCILTSTDYGRNFTAFPVPFSPDVISFHPDNQQILLAIDKTTKKLWISEDFGAVWVTIQKNVKAFYWGVDGIDNPDTLFVVREEPGGTSAILQTAMYFKGEEAGDVLITGVEEFHLYGKYMFACRRVKHPGSKTKEGMLQMWVSYNRQPFDNSIFPNSLPHLSYFIAGNLDNQIFLCVAHGGLLANLYVSDEEGIRYSLSLERLLYFDPKQASPNRWLRYVPPDVIADFHKVHGLNGVFIASQLKEDYAANGLGPEDVVTLISFDGGNVWKPINPPQVDYRGHPIDCHLPENCSLHLFQQISILYPATRAVPILSAKSAIGLIMATGVVGKSLKGHPKVYLSADGGVQWHEVLNGNYLYAFGDHGGIIVAVRYFRARGGTREILYSTDEGETWNTHQFSSEEILVHGLLTEPGERTTVFTLFGSYQERSHDWILVKIDLRSAFKYDCKREDFQPWSPVVDPSIPRTCLFGQKEVYERRIPRANCYNGEDYERVVSIESCECHRSDFECDLGFKNDAIGLCTRDNSSSYDPYAIPASCVPGAVYNRTKGYRRIPGDICKGGQELQYEPDRTSCPIKLEEEFALFAQRKQISRISLTSDVNSASPDAIPLPNLENVIAIEYDVMNSTLYWADINTDKILRLRLDGGSNAEVLVETDLKSVEGIALDWVSNNLYFVDGELARIDVIRTDTHFMGRMRRTILNNTVLNKPRAVAVHPMKGFLFWSDWGSVERSISRAFLDGVNVSRIITKPHVFWPNGITIDYQAERIYWVDAKLDYIASAELDGSNMRYVIQNSATVPHPFAVAVYKDWIYWDDWNLKGIFLANKNDGSGIQMLASGLPDITDLKVFGHGSHSGTNPCASGSVHTCTHLCMGRPNNGHTCLCPAGTVRVQKLGDDERCLCNEGQEILANGTCKETNHRCKEGQFTCKNRRCVATALRCDGDNDCGDNSDEQECDISSCGKTQFRCRNGKCVLPHWRCDFMNDCDDGSDEEGCTYPACRADQFQCTDQRCIPIRWRCDSQHDCPDGSDEEDCGTPEADCRPDEFLCNATKKCLPLSYVCDRIINCPDSSDEERCDNTTCPDWQYQCTSDGECIHKLWRCDGEVDCKDGSDELHCNSTTTAAPRTTATMAVPRATTTTAAPRTTTTTAAPRTTTTTAAPRTTTITAAPRTTTTTAAPRATTTTAAPTTTTSRPCASGDLTCNNGQCVPFLWKCDGEDDCGDGSDELHCNKTTTTAASTTTTSGPCASGFFMCNNGGQCVPFWWKCDGVEDCRDGSDELHCNKTTTTAAPTTTTSHPCASGFHTCSSGHCVPFLWICDGVEDCQDGSDELHCNKTATTAAPTTTTSGPCGSGLFTCSNGQCVSFWWRCDGVEDCKDGSDELHCNKTTTTAAPTTTTSGPCTSGYFMCNNGQCVSPWWKCDGEVDCRDGSDELHCNKTATTAAPTTTTSGPCGSGYFMCHNGQCVSFWWKCDGEEDCGDGSDELHCNKTATTAAPTTTTSGPCGSGYFMCHNGQCVSFWWKCDGEEDCGDGSDELHCNKTTTTAAQTTTTSGPCGSGFFMCNNGQCVSFWWKCDGVEDCGDGSDELHCNSTTTTPKPPTTRKPQITCPENQYRCHNGKCIWLSYLCDGSPDCNLGEDEINCTSFCGNGSFRCLYSSGCIPENKVCDGINDCVDASDEQGCPFSSSTVMPTCKPTEFTCKVAGECVDFSRKCDGPWDCRDGSDEQGCGSETQHVVKEVMVDYESVTNTSFDISWTPPGGQSFVYLPSICAKGSKTWVNNTKWTSGVNHSFKGLEPYTTYNITVYVKLESSPNAYPAHHYFSQTTMANEPAPPHSIKLTQTDGLRVLIQWEPPSGSHKDMRGYNIYIFPPRPYLTVIVKDPKSTRYNLNMQFQPGVNYSFWMTSLGKYDESQPSQIATFVFDKDSISEAVSHVVVVNASETTIHVRWRPLTPAPEAYKLKLMSANAFVHYPEVLLKTTSFTAENLSPGTRYVFSIMGVKDGIDGPPSQVVGHTQGDPLKAPTNFKARLINGTRVNVSWSPPQDTRKEKWVYCLYYAQSVSALLRAGCKKQTTNTSYVVDDLDACEMYVFDVRLVGPIGHGPSEGFRTVATEYDRRASPKNLRAVQSAYSPLKMVVTWNASCEVVDEPIGYDILIRETRLNQDWRFAHSPTQDSGFMMNLTVNLGGHYMIRVKTNFKNSRPSDPVYYDANEIPPPHHVKMVEEADGSIFIYWDDRDLPAEIQNYAYVVYVSQNGNMSDANKYFTNERSMHLSGMRRDQVYSLYVTLRDALGFESPPSEILLLKQLRK